MIKDLQHKEMYLYYVNNFETLNDFASVWEFQKINKTFKPSNHVWRAIGRHLTRMSLRLGYPIKYGYMFFRPEIPHMYYIEVWERFFEEICRSNIILSQYRVPVCLEDLKRKNFMHLKKSLIAC